VYQKEIFKKFCFCLCLKAYIYVFFSALSCLFWSGCSRQQKCHAAAPPPAGVRRRTERNRQKPVGQDKGSLTEQQTEGTGTTTIQKKKKEYTKQTRRTEPRSRTEPPLCAPKPRVSSRPPLSPTGTQRDDTRYGTPGSVGPGGVSPHPLAVPLPGFQ